MARERCLKLPESFLAMMSGLDDVPAAAVVRLTAAHYLEGVVPKVEDGARLVRVHAEDWRRILIEIGGFLDHSELRRGRVVLTVVGDAVSRRDAETNSRSEAANRRNDEKRFRMMAEGRSEPLTRGRIAKRGAHAQDSDLCTLVHDDGCTRVQEDAHLCIIHGCTLVHNPAGSHRDSEIHGSTTLHVDAHLCKNDGNGTDGDGRSSGDGFAETAENRHSHGVDSEGGRGQTRASRGTTKYSSSLLETDNYYESRGDLGGDGSRHHEASDLGVLESGRDHRGDGDQGSDSGGQGSGYSTNGGHTAKFARNHDNTRRTGGQGDAYDGVGDPSSRASSDGDRRPARPSQGGSTERVGRDDHRAGSGARQSAGPASEPDPVIDEFVDRLNDFGSVPIADARKAVGGWLDRHGEGLVRRVFDAVPVKPLDRPVSYMDAVMRKTRAREDESLPTGSPVRTGEAAGGSANAGRSAPRPKPVKRWIRPTLNAQWELLGWSAIGEANTTGNPETRRMAWRTDAGTVKFLKPEDEIVPGFDEDPGIYLVD